MQCNHKLAEKYLFDYVDGRLQSKLTKELDKAIENCNRCRDDYHHLEELQNISRRWTDEHVSNWHRTNFAVRPQVIQTNWMNLSSIALSMTAITIVIFQLNSSNSIGNVNAVLESGIFDQKINNIINSKLDEIQPEFNFSKEQEIIYYMGQISQNRQIYNGNNLISQNSEYLPLFKIPPSYPPEALRNKIEGYVIVEFEVTSHGTTNNIKVIDSDPPGVFDQAALEVAEKFRYQPRYEDGVPVDVPGVQNKITWEIGDDNSDNDNNNP